MANTVLESATVNNDVAAVMYNVTCATPAATAAKTATASEKFALFSGVRIRVAFTNGNTASNPTLSINSTVSVPLKADGENPIDAMAAGAVVDVIYDGTNYIVSGTGTIPPVVKSWAEDTFVSKAGALTGVTATSPLSASTSSGIATVSHDDSGVTAGSKGDTTSQTPQFGGTFKALSGTVDAKGHLTAFGEHTVTIPSSTATQSASGLMSSSDKTKLDGIADGADAVAFTQTQTSGTEIGTLTINSDATKLYAPVQTDISGNAGTATTLQTARTIDGALFNGSADVVHYGFCTTSGLNLTVDIPSFTGTTLVEGARIVVRFQNASNSSGPSLNVSNTGAHNIALKTMPGTFTPPGNDYWSAGAVLEFVYTNGYWVITNGEKASTTTCGVVKLSTATNSTSNSLAATPSAVKAAYDLASGKPDLISTAGAVPLMDGTASVGTSSAAARSDHVHPSDVTLVPLVGKGRNIFENWYFVGGGTAGRFPVNQRGKLSYEPLLVHGIDRWLNALTSVSLVQNGIEISSNTQYSAFLQYVNEDALIEGQSYALSVIANDTLFWWVVTPSKSAAWQATYGWMGAFYPYCVWQSAKNCWELSIATNSDNSGATQSITIKAAKLELGSRQTLASQVGNAWVINDTAPNYQQELAKCQRYFEAGIEWQVMVDGNGMFRGTVPYKVTKAGDTVPSIVSGTAVYWNGATWVDASNNISVDKMGNRPEFGCVLAAVSLPANAIFNVQINASAE